MNTNDKVKIIHILSHIPNPAHLTFKDPKLYFKTPEFGSYHLLDYPPYWVGFFALDHHVFAASDLLQLTDEFDVECWRPYGFGLKEPHEEMVNGIKHRVFPAYKINIPQFGHLTWSKELFAALIEEINSNKVIVNLSVGHAWFHIKLMIKLKKYKHKFGLVALHRSGGFRKFSHTQLDWWKKPFKFYYFIESHIDEYSLRFADIYFVGAKPEADYLSRPNSKVKSKFFMEGIDFSNYRVLSSEEKRELREHLGLPLDKKLLIAYGNWKSKDYAYQHLLEVYREIKISEEGKDLELVMIGGYKAEDLYKEGVESGAIMIERVSKSVFITYLEASDFFTQACFNWGFIQFGGFGTAMIEALACGLPVISANIIHFPGTVEELEQIGMNMRSKEELKNNIIYLKNNLGKFTKCREIAQKYYDINNTRKILRDKYRALAYKYFKVIS